MRALATVVLFAGVAVAQVPIELHDLAGTDGEWQEGVAVIPAPRAQIHQWLTDYQNWPRRFPDIGWATVLGDDAEGRHIVRFSSHIVDAIITVHEKVTPELLVFTGTAPYTHTQGRIYLIDLGDGTTRVIMQSTAKVHGFWKIFATKGLKRERAYRVTRSHLQALYDLATKGDRVLDLTRGR
jgi:hypothetical protein